MNLCDLAPEYIRAISPYQPGKPISELAREMGMDQHSIIKLASNENPLGTSPLALKAMGKALDESVALSGWKRLRIKDCIIAALWRNEKSDCAG